jgi:hypothetical protein
MVMVIMVVTSMRAGKEGQVVNSRRRVNVRDSDRLL